MDLMDFYTLDRLRITSVTEPDSSHVLQAILSYFKLNCDCIASKMMSFIKDYYKLPAHHSLDMKILVRYLEKIPFLERSTYLSSNGKKLDKFVRNDTLWNLHQIYQTALMIAKQHNNASAHEIMTKALQYRYVSPCMSASHFAARDYQATRG